MNKVLYHNYLFTLGFVFYLVVPIFIVENKILASFPAMRWIYQDYKTDVLPIYILVLILFYFSFYLGSRLPIGRRFKLFSETKPRPTVVKRELTIGNRDIFLLMTPFFLLGQLLILKNRGSLFSGYQNDYDTVFLGTIATLNSIFLFFYLYKKNKSKRGSSYLDYFLIFALVEFSIVLLSLGSRMYVMIPFVSCLIYFLDHQIISMKKLLIIAGIIGAIFLSVGYWRVGRSEFSLDVFIYLLLSEPLLTWISALSMFTSNTLPIIDFPLNFLTSFLNFIPTFLLPFKAELIQDLSIDYHTPFGATSILVSLISNFGILGSCFFLFMGGFLLTYIRLHGHTVFYRSYYYCICAILPFQLFRDDFAILNKMLLYNFFLLPFVFYLIEKYLYKKAKHENNS